MLVNGQFQDSVPLSNRGLAYGDGLFETILIEQGRPVLLAQHLQRLSEGCHRLGLSDCLPQLHEDLATLASHFPERGVLKVMVTRGEGGRGYRVADHASPQRLLTLHPAPDVEHAQQGIHVFISPIRLARQPLLAGMKHLNRLEQVMASRLWPDERCFEGLMLDDRDALVEGTRSNLFLVDASGELCTPPLDEAGVDGILRQVLIQRLGKVSVRRLLLSDLSSAREVFFCNSVGGVWPVLSLQASCSDGHFRQDLYWSPGDAARQAGDVFRAALSESFQ